LVRLPRDEGRGAELGDARTTAVPVLRTARRGAQPRLPGDGAADADAAARGRAEQEGQQLPLRLPVREGGVRHVAAGAPRPGPEPHEPGYCARRCRRSVNTSRSMRKNLTTNMTP